MRKGLTDTIMQKLEDISVDEALRALIIDTSLIDVVCCLDMIARESGTCVSWIEGKDGKTIYPVKATKVQVIGAVHMMRELIERGYTYDSKGAWVCEGEISFIAWHMCGHSFNDTPPNSRWPEWMLEQVEVTE